MIAKYTILWLLSVPVVLIVRYTMIDAFCDENSTVLRTVLTMAYELSVVASYYALFQIGYQIYKKVTNDNI